MLAKCCAAVLTVMAVSLDQALAGHEDGARLGRRRWPLQARQRASRK
jgi:hypothetical protein